MQSGCRYGIFWCHLCCNSQQSCQCQHEALGLMWRIVSTWYLRLGWDERLSCVVQSCARQDKRLSRVVQSCARQCRIAQNCSGKLRTVSRGAGSCRSVDARIGGTSRSSLTDHVWLTIVRRYKSQSLDRCQERCFGGIESGNFPPDLVSCVGARQRNSKLLPKREDHARETSLNPTQRSFPPLEHPRGQSYAFKIGLNHDNTLIMA